MMEMIEQMLFDHNRSWFHVSPGRPEYPGAVMACCGSRPSALKQYAESLKRGAREGACRLATLRMGSSIQNAVLGHF